MREIDGCLEALVQAVKDSDAYERYQNIRSQIREYPQKAQRLNEFRRKNYFLQNSREQVDLYVETDRLEEEYADLFKDPLTNEYLAAEVALCRVLQHINRELVDCLGFETVL